MLLAHIPWSVTLEFLLASYTAMLDHLKLMWVLKHVVLEFFVLKIAIFSIFCCFLSLFWPKNQFLWVLFAIMKFHTASQVKNNTGTTFHQTNMAESTVNTQARPLQNIVSQIINFHPYSSTCHFMSLSHTQILIKYGEFINIPTTMQNCGI